MSCGFEMGWVTGRSGAVMYLTWISLNKGFQHCSENPLDDMCAIHRAEYTGTERKA